MRLFLPAILLLVGGCGDTYAPPEPPPSITETGTVLHYALQDGPEADSLAVTITRNDAEATVFTIDRNGAMNTLALPASVRRSAPDGLLLDFSGDWTLTTRTALRLPDETVERLKRDEGDEGVDLRLGEETATFFFVGCGHPRVLELTSGHRWRIETCDFLGFAEGTTLDEPGATRPSALPGLREACQQGDAEACDAAQAIEEAALATLKVLDGDEPLLVSVAMPDYALELRYATTR